MDKNKIKDDFAFSSKCIAYGLDWNDFNIYKDTIILNSPKKDIFVLLDDNYNTIGIHKMEHNSKLQDIEKYAIKYRDLYNYVDYNNELNLLYPFQNFSLKQIAAIIPKEFSRVTINENQDNLIINLRGRIPIKMEDIDYGIKLGQAIINGKIDSSNQKLYRHK